MVIRLGRHLCIAWTRAEGRLLDDRRAAVLKTIVEEHVRSGQPVGSTTVMRQGCLDVSSATVRNDMVWLEAEGYISQPHKSAGRIPSDSGYRYFVDHYASVDRLSSAEQRRVSRFYERRFSDLDLILDATSQMLAKWTSLAAIVLSPDPRSSVLTSVHLSLLAPHRLLVVLVTRAGRVLKMVIDAKRDFLEKHLVEAEQALDQMLVGDASWLVSPLRPPKVSDSCASEIASMVCRGISGFSSSEMEMYFRGASFLVNRFGEIEVVHDLLDVLERRHVVSSTLQELASGIDGDVGVGIGSEMPTEFQLTSVVFAPYRIGGDTGILGVVGPTRMDYSRAMSQVTFVSQQLANALLASD